MMQCDRKREGLRECRAAWLIGVTVREYREIEAGNRTPSLDTYRRISELYGWPADVRWRDGQLWWRTRPFAPAEGLGRGRSVRRMRSQ